MNWKPTNEIRLVRRGIDLSAILGGPANLVLQQRWEEQFVCETGDVKLSSNHCRSEWRDVPTVTEESK